jgi:D-psicose/D-tagatose/L-ribulose 3-epimerase
MRLGLCTADPARIRAARDWGYDYVEIAGRSLAPLESEASWHPLRRELEDTGATISHLNSFIPADVRCVGPEVDWGRVRGYLESCAARAAEVGVRTFVWGSAPSKRVPIGWPLSRAFDQLERTAHLISDALAPRGGTCAIEPLNARETNVIYHLTDGVLLAAAVDRQQMRVLADYYHMALLNEPLAHIEAARPWLAHTHTAGADRHFPKPTDGLDHRAYLAALRAAGYDGALSLECSRVPEGADFGVEARAGVAYYRRLLDEVAAS